MLELATAADREAVNAIAKQVHDLHVAWRPDIYQAAEEQFDEELFAESIRNRQIYVAKISGEVAGFVALKRCTYDWPGVVKRHVMMVEEFGVHESCRGHGIGRAMMEDIHALAKVFGCSDLQLRVYPQNDEAVGFYQKCGFTIQNIGMQKKV
jgi:ribosomal protein S18 acetylase RimI-like enzyme